MNKKQLAFLAMAALMLSACVQKDTYSWGSYEQDLYNYYRDSEKQGDLQSNLASLLAEAEASGKIPPGLYAEYGYLLLQQGQLVDSRKYFELEKTTWPESTTLMDAMIKVTMIEDAKQKVGTDLNKNEEGEVTNASAAQ